MRPLSAVVAAMVLTLSLAGCKSEAEKQISEITDKQKEIVTILKGVTDKDSAKAANEKLKGVAKDLTAIMERVKKTSPSQDEQKRLMEKYKSDQEQAKKDIQAEMERIAKIPGASMELMSGMMEIGMSAMKANIGNK